MSIKEEEEDLVIMHSNYCVECSQRATFIYNGNSLCTKCFYEQKDNKKPKKKTPKK